jgi:hypothetical protein
MLCYGKSGNCNTNVEPKRLTDRDHYECEECREKWDTNPASIMDSSGQITERVIRRSCTCPLR